MYLFHFIYDSKVYYPINCIKNCNTLVDLGKGHNTALFCDCDSAGPTIREYKIKQIQSVVTSWNYIHRLNLVLLFLFFDSPLGIGLFGQCQ